MIPLDPAMNTRDPSGLTAMDVRVWLTCGGVLELVFHTVAPVAALRATVT